MHRSSNVKHEFSGRCRYLTELSPRQRLVKPEILSMEYNGVAADKYSYSFIVGVYYRVRVVGVYYCWALFNVYNLRS